jgi:hypothetical protein
MSAPDRRATLPLPPKCVGKTTSISPSSSPPTHRDTSFPRLLFAMREREIQGDILPPHPRNHPVNRAEKNRHRRYSLHYFLLWTFLRKLLFVDKFFLTNQKNRPIALGLFQEEAEVILQMPSDGGKTHGGGDQKILSKLRNSGPTFPERPPPPPSPPLRSRVRAVEWGGLVDFFFFCGCVGIFFFLRQQQQLPREKKKNRSRRRRPVRCQPLPLADVSRKNGTDPSVASTTLF